MYDKIYNKEDNKEKIIRKDAERTGKGVRKDRRIWDNPEFGYSESRYFELKREGLRKLAKKKWGIYKDCTLSAL